MKPNKNKILHQFYIFILIKIRFFINFIFLSSFVNLDRENEECISHASKPHHSYICLLYPKILTKHNLIFKSEFFKSI